MANTAVQTRTSVLSASTLIGDKVNNRAGENLGKLEELMIDLTTGRVAYGVLSFGGVMGMGEKLFAIPFQAFKVDQDNHRLLLDVEKDKLKNAPGFDKNHWPETADRTWATQIHDYYGYRPYWETTL